MNITQVLVLETVSDDMNSGKAFYDKQEEGVGNYFWDSLISDIESLIIYAGIHSKKYGIYRMLSRRFPYAVYYEIIKNIAYVIAVLPMRRDPEWIESTLQKRS